MSPPTLAFVPKQQVCPDCDRTRQQERETPEICEHRFHDRLPAWKGWTP